MKNVKRLLDRMQFENETDGKRIKKLEKKTFKKVKE